MSIRWQVMAAVMGVAVVGLVGGMPEHPAPPAPDGVPMPEPVTPSAVLPSPPPALQRPSPSAAAPGRPQDVVHSLCDLGTVSLPDGDASASSLPSPLGEHALPAWLPSWQAHLATGDARAAAAGLLFAPTPPSGESEATAELVKMARTTRDPVVWAWAFGRCGAEPDTAACASLDPADWARDDPGNAWPWLLVGASNPQRRREALGEAARATRMQSYPGQLVHQILLAAPPTMPRYLRHQPTLDAMGTEALFVPPSADYLKDYCGTAAGERVADCQAVADRLVLASDAWRGVDLGLALGARLGWPADRLGALQPGQRHEDRLAMPLLTGAAQPHACDSIDAVWQRVADVAARGEVAAGRQAALAAAPSPGHAMPGSRPN